MNLARQLVRELDAKSPGVLDMLTETGGAFSAAVIAHVALHAERLAATRSGRR